MTLSNVQAVYPDGIFPWVDRVDEQDIVFAEDVNPLAAEIESIEQTIGTTPQIEPNPPQGGTPITYSSISSRISAAMDNSNLPVVSLGNSSFTCPNNTVGNLLPYFRRFDPFNCYNGSDVTVPASGWWIVTSTQTWDWWSDGYSCHRLCLNGIGGIIHEQFIDWEFSGNLVPNNPQFGVVDGQIVPVPTGSRLPNVFPRYWEFGKRPRQTTTTWQGLLNAGDRLSSTAENGTSNASHSISNMSFKAIMIKTVTGSFTSG